MHENEALAFRKNQRGYLPKTYSDRKNNIARQHNETLSMCVDVDDPQEINIEKQHVLEEISTKMRAMTNLCMDLTVEEVDLFQTIVEASDSDLR